MLRRVPVGETGYAEPYGLASGKEDPVVMTLAKMLGAKFIEGER